MGFLQRLFGMEQEEANHSHIILDSGFFDPPPPYDAEQVIVAVARTAVIAQWQIESIYAEDNGGLSIRLNPPKDDGGKG